MKKRILFFVTGLLLAGVACAQGTGADVRNVIYMIGDGMGLAQVSMLKVENDYAPTAFDRAEGVALVVTRSANNRVTDSAAAATALATGHKTNNAMLGQDPAGNPCESMISKAEAKGLPTGIVVTSYLQHATPAGFYAHVANRDDSPAITRDMLVSGIDVLLGGGRKWLSEETPEGGDYLEAFRHRGYTVVEKLEDADAVHSGSLLGVMSEGHLPRAAKRGDYLPQATRKALEVLSSNAARDNKGFLLMVEGSLIDYGGHENDAEGLLAEMRDFERAVAVAMDYADRTPGTLVVVVADHETGGLSLLSGDEDFTQGESGMEYNFATHSHSAAMVPVYLYGAGADKIAGIMDNTDLALRIMELQGLK